MKIYTNNFLKYLHPFQFILFCVCASIYSCPSEREISSIGRGNSLLDTPESVTGLNATAISSTAIYIKWCPLPISHYAVFIGQVGRDFRESINTSKLYATFSNLLKFTRYNVYVTALHVNASVRRYGYMASGHHHNDYSMRSGVVIVRTLSDIPSGSPRRVRVEYIDDTRVSVTWLIPQPRDCNGIISSYVVQYSPLRDLSSTSTPTAELNTSQPFIVLRSLRNGAEYKVRVAAVNDRGTGPFSQWQRFTVAPPIVCHSSQLLSLAQPLFVYVYPTTTEIYLRWNVERNDPCLQGFTIGWGRGLADVNSVVVSDAVNNYTIQNLDPLTDYVITLRAFNSRGNGTPVYETIRTLPFVGSVDHDLHLTMPAALKAITISESAIILSWSYSTNNNDDAQNIWYRVRYRNTASNSVFSYYNSSGVSCIIDKLGANTEYEFSVRAFQGNKYSRWSFVVTNRTAEALPSSAPRNFSIYHINNSTNLLLTWFPPAKPNGRITGYIIQYTANMKLVARKWDVITVTEGATNNVSVTHLVPDTKYVFRIQAKNSVGNGPHTTNMFVRTKPDIFSARKDAKKIAKQSSHPFVSTHLILLGTAFILFITFSVLLVALIYKKFCLHKRGGVNSGYTHSIPCSALKSGHKTSSCNLFPPVNATVSETAPLASDLLWSAESSRLPLFVDDASMTSSNCASDIKNYVIHDNPTYSALQSPSIRSCASSGPKIVRDNIHRSTFYTSFSNKSNDFNSAKQLPNDGNQPQALYDVDKSANYFSPSSFECTNHCRGEGPVSCTSYLPLLNKQINQDIDIVFNDEVHPFKLSASTDKLTEEMANLEGLMKDLNAITASDFQ